MRISAARTMVVGGVSVLAAAGIAMLVGPPAVTGQATPNAEGVHAAVCDGKFDESMAVYDRLPQIGEDFAVLMGLAQISGDAALVKQNDQEWQADIDTWSADMNGIGYAAQCADQPGMGPLADVSYVAKDMFGEIDRLKALNNAGSRVTMFDLNDRVDALRSSLTTAHLHE
jgi:hypothetical protein